MQHGFWQDFSAAHFLDMRHKRNLNGHTDELEGEDVVPLGTGIIQDLHTALGRTLFPVKAGPDQREFLMSRKCFATLNRHVPAMRRCPTIRSQLSGSTKTIGSSSLAWVGPRKIG